MRKLTQKQQLRNSTQEIAALELAITDQQTRQAEDRAYLIREANSLRSLIVDMVKEQRTLKLRFDWLEEAAREVCTSCENHVFDAIGRLADELGIEITEDQDNGNT